MGGRGASSGTSKAGNRYGSQYRTLLTSGNIKFVEKTGPQSETLMETKTYGRVYVRVDSGGNLREIVYFDRDNRRNKQIDLAHKHDGISPHAHHGYKHDEGDSAKGYSKLTTEERAMVERIVGIWNNRKRGR